MKPTIYKGCGDKDDKDDISASFTYDDVYPNLLIRNMKRLEISSAEFVFVAYLTKDGFSGDWNCIVASSLKEMHRATGLATGTIHKAKSGLVNKGLVQILNKRNKERTNTYNLLPLREKLAEFAEWKLPAPPELKANKSDLSPQA